MKTREYPKMNPEPKRLLIEALRSGRYEQGRNALRTTRPDGTVKHCCLGVLVELAVEHGVVLDHEDVTQVNGSSIRQYRHANRDGKVAGVPPDAVCEWAGISEDLDFKVSSVIDEMVRMNDNKRESFAVIADWVEVNL